MTPGLQAVIAGCKASGGIYFGESAGFGDSHDRSRQLFIRKGAGRILLGYNVRPQHSANGDRACIKVTGQSEISIPSWPRPLLSKSAGRKKISS